MYKSFILPQFEYTDIVWDNCSGIFSNVFENLHFDSRKEKVKHCRLRLPISDLNYDLFRRHLLEDPICSWGYTAETSEHFLLHCPLYNSIKNKTINKLDVNEININTLLFGNDQLHLETNKKIFAIVHDFLRQTDRL